MKKLTVCVLMGLSLCGAQAQILLNSWTNSLEGWTIVEPKIWTNEGFSTTIGVTPGTTYSWELTALSGPDYGLAFVGPSSTNLTALMINAASVSLDIDVPTAGSFGYYMQWDLVVNQPGGAGSISTDGYTYSASPVIGGTATMTWTIPEAIQQKLAAYPTLPTYLSFQVGGGGGGTIYIDYLRVTPVGLINSWENSAEGWTIVEPKNWTNSGFSTNIGVTAGFYSWELTAASNPDYGEAFAGPTNTSLTALLANAASVSLDIDVPTAGTFGYYMQWDLVVNQPGGLGYQSTDGYSYSQSPVIGGTATMTWTIPQSIRNGLVSNPMLPTGLAFQVGGGGGGTIYIDNLRATLLPPAPAQLWVRELWDDQGKEVLPATTTFADDSSSVGFASSSPWVCNPAETPTNTQLMGFRPGFNNEGSIDMGLPGSLDGTEGCMVQENNGFSFTPTPGGPTFWTAGDFMTRALAPNNFINFQAVGEYWFAMTISDSRSSLDSQYVTFPSSGAGGFGFADGSTTNANFVAVGVTGLNVYFGPTNATNNNGQYPFVETDASKSVYISQGTLGQPGNSNSTVYNPLDDPNANPADAPPNYAPPYNSEYTQTNFTAGPYHINAFGVLNQGQVEGDSIVVLGHLKTLGGGNATLDAKFYSSAHGQSWNNNLDTTTSNITWDCSYAFNFGGTMTQMLLFENGQFPFYVFGFRASTNFAGVVGIDPGRIAVAPLANTYVGYPINMTNLAAEANQLSFTSPPANYGTLTYQWYQNGLLITNATSQYLNIASASLSDTNMPAGTDAGTYSCVATDPSGTWGSVSASTVVTVTHLVAPTVTSVQFLRDQATINITFDEPNLTGVGNTNSYVFSDGIVATNATLIPSTTTTEVQLQTAGLPLGTRVTLTISGVTNVVGEALAATSQTQTFWTDLIQTGVAAWDYWLIPSSVANSTYFSSWLPANPYPTILTNMTLTTWEGPSSGITILGTDGYAGDTFGDKVTGWFIPPVTTNYVFFVCADDQCRLSLSTNSSPSNLFVIAAGSDWSGAEQWTNVNDSYPTKPHAGDGTAFDDGTIGAVNGYIWDNSAAEGYTNAQGVFVITPATADDQNRSDQFIVAYFDALNGGLGLPGEPAGATLAEQALWATWADTSEGPLTQVVAETNFWPNVDANGQALISLKAGQMYYMVLDHEQNGGGYLETVTYKIAGAPDPLSPSPSILTGSVIAGLAPFAPTISIAEKAGVPEITYTGVLWSGPTVLTITNQVAISSNGPSQYTPPLTKPAMFYRTSE